MVEMVAIWSMMAGALTIGYVLRWWETKPETVQQRVDLAAERDARRKFELLLDFERKQTQFRR